MTVINISDGVSVKTDDRFALHLTMLNIQLGLDHTSTTVNIQLHTSRYEAFIELHESHI